MKNFVAWSMVFAVALLGYIFRPASKELPKYKLAVGIFSAREHFIQRETIRSTWLSVLSDKELANEVFIRFVLANRDCEIPLEYRKSEYCCEELRKFSFDFEDAVHLVSFGDLDNSLGQYAADFVTVAYDFTVTYDVIVSGISIPRIQGNDSVIQLWDLASDTVVLESKPDDHHKNNDLWTGREVHPHLLPKGFVGSVIVLCGRITPCFGMKNWFRNTTFHPAIEISPILRYSRERGEFPLNVKPMELAEMMLPASLLLQIADVDKVRSFQKSKRSAFEIRQRRLREVAEKLKKENEEHDDIVFLSDVDGGELKEVYRNLPRKLISFHQWCCENIDAEMIMKTDDDSYVDIEKVLKSVNNVDSSGYPLWLGNFRWNWPVDRYGKWAEYQYTSSEYPAYACGGGNVVSSETSHFLARNGKSLKYYQGEDISMGLWLSSIDVKYVQHSLWLCDNECIPQMALSTQHSPASLLRFWTNRVKCDNPCQCK